MKLPLYTQDLNTETGLTEYTQVDKQVDDIRKVIESLTRAVPPDDIHTRVQGKKKDENGRWVENKVPYVEGNYVIDRLNEALTQFGWNLRKRTQDLIADQDFPNKIVEISVYAELEIVTRWGIVTKGDYGSASVKYQDEKFYNVATGKQEPTGRRVPMSIADDMKGAMTDALKRAARQLGIYNYGYRKEAAKPQEGTVELASQLLAESKALNFTKTQLLDFCGGVVHKTVLSANDLSADQISICMQVLKTMKQLK